jgi:putative ABC transport system substrate-binding protein
MDRRAFIGTFGVAVLATPLAATAQPASRIPRVGFLEPGAPTVNRHFADALRQGLRELGYAEGRDIIIEERWGEGRIERFPVLVAELTRSGVEVIVAASTDGALAAKKTTTTTPIVFVGVADPVGSGVVSNLARPGGNVTGLSFAFGEGFAGKWLELLKEALPKLSRAAILYNPAQTQRLSTHYVKELRVAGDALGVTLQLFEVRDSNEFARAFAVMAREQLGGLIVLPDPLTLRHRASIVELSNKGQLPAMFGFAEYARAGGLMAYGPSVPDLFRRAATYVDRILKGAKPADLPIEQPTKFELVINLKTAKALGLTIPQSLLLRADQVIE